MIRNLQKGRETDHKTTTMSKNPNGTYKPVLTTQEGGDAMELDATQRAPNLNLAAQEFRWRRNTKDVLNAPGLDI